MGTEVEVAMPTTQPSTVSSPGGVISSVTMNRGSVQGEGVNNDQFPAGLRVLVVDDDPICLLILDRMLRQCLYKVRTCGRATDALAILRENREMFDLVISDVYMPDMDGFKLLELVGLEMDLPVIMMSANGETSAVMKGIRHGACDYLLKPVRIEELKNIWQHVVRKKRREPELVGSLDDKRRHDDGGDGGELYSSANDAADGTLKHPKKRKDVKEEEEDAELDSEDPSTSKKPRVVWSVDLHQQFVSAVNQLGIDKAFPKRILELMNVQGLTRENVASHLQKYRLYLKRISGVAHQPGGLNSAFVGAPDPTFGAAGGGGLACFGDLRALAATGQLSPQALISTLQAGLLGRLGPPNNSGMAGVDPSLLLQIAALHGVNSTAMVRPSYGQPLLNSPGSLHPSIASGLDLKQHAQGPQQISSFGQTGAAIDKGPAGLATLQQQLSGPASLGGVGQLIGMDNNLPASPNNNSLMMQILQQQAGSQMANGSVLNSSTGGQHLLSSDIGARLPNVSNLTTGIGSGVGAPVRPAQDSSLGVTSFASSNGLGSLRRTMGVDNKNLHLANAGNGNISLPPNVSSPSASNGIDGGLIATGRKGLVSNVGEGLPQTGRGVAPNSLPLTGANPGSRPNMGLNNWQGWQSLGPSQEPPTTASHVLSPRYSQGSSGGQALKMGCAQEQGQGRVSGPAAGSMGFQDRFIVDIGRFKPLISNAPSHNEQSTADSEIKLKEGTFELFLGSKAENGLLPEPFLSDDLLNSYFKQQQQEVMGFTEGDLAADGYTLGNMYVK